MNGYGHFLPRVRSFQRVLGAGARCCSRSPATSSGCAARRATGAAGCAIARARFTRPVAAIAASRPSRWRRWRRRVHLLQHQRPQPLRHDARRQSAGRPTTRRSTRRLAAEAAAEDHAVERRRRHLPARAARAHARAPTRSRTRSGRPVEVVHLDFLAGPIAERSTSSRSACRATLARRRPARSACAATGSPRRSRPARRTELDIRPRGRDARLHATPARHRRRRQRHVRQQRRRCCRSSATRSAPSSRPTATARSTASRRRSACATATIPQAPARELHLDRRRLDHFEATVSTEPDQIAIAPGYLSASGPRAAGATSTTRWTARSSTSTRSCRRATRSKRDRWNDVADRDLLPPGPRVQPRPDDRRDEGLARLLHAGFGPYQHRQVRILEFPRYATLRAGVPEHHPVLGGHRLHRARARRTIPRTSTTRTTSPRTRSRTSGGRTR